MTVTPHLVLLDLKLPKLGGLEVLQHLRADLRTMRIPVVALSSSDENRYIVACYESHVNSYVRKPVDFVQFMEAVRQLRTYWLEINETPAV